jgi:myo-inositol-1(or 4)-monophosphatase
LNGIGFRTLSEERGISGPEDAAYFAIIDPLDGSSVAVRGMDTYAVAIACGPIVDGDILFSNIEFGVVASHYGLFYAQRGLGAYLNEDALSVSSVTSIGDAVLRQSRYSFLLLESSGSLLLGSTALEISLIAAGVMDAYVEPKKRKVFDYAAASLILREAGGYLTTMEGGALHRGPLDVLSTSDLLATCTESLAQEINHALAKRT